MKKILPLTLCSFLMLMISICLVGCGAQETALQGVDKETIPQDGHEIYGISYAVPEAQWTYMFNADQLGTGEELIDLDISGGEAKKGLEAYWKEACETEDDGEDNYVLKGSGEETIDGRECFWYDKYDNGDTYGSEGTPCWRKVLLVPQSSEGKYIEIRSDFIEAADKKKADKYFEELLNGIEFVDSKAYIVNEDYICIGGVCISARGLKPVQFVHGLMEEEEADGLICVQIDFGNGSGMEELYPGAEETKGDEGSPLLDEGRLEVDGVKGKWQKWIDRVDEGLTYLGYYVILPVDELQENATIEYNFNGDVDDLSQYDDQIKELTEQLHVTKSK